MPLIPRQCRGERKINMTEKNLKNNQAVVAGEIISDFEFSHEVFDEGFYLSREDSHLFQVVSDSKFVSVGVQSPTEINAPRGCAVIL